MPLNRIAQRLFMPLAAGTLAACAIVPKPDNQTRAGFSMERMTVEGCVPATDQPPVLVKAKAPDYPVKRRIVGEEGFTELQYDITITGTVDNVVNLNSSHPAFYASTRVAVLDWQFEPAVSDGSPVRVTCKLRQNFTK